GVAVERAGDRHLAAAARLLAAHQRRRLLDLGTQAALDRRLLLRLLLAGRLDLAGRGQRRDLGGGGLAGALGHFAARFVLGLALGLFLALAPRLFLGLETELLLGLALGFRLGARLLLLALTADIDDGLPARLLVGLLG